jgi:hypothetical protein
MPSGLPESDDYQNGHYTGFPVFEVAAVKTTKTAAV